MAKVGLQEAVRKAEEIIRELYPEDVLRDLLLEEIELSREDLQDVWLVTLGFTRPAQTTVAASVAGLVPNLPAVRAYKRIKIDAETGAFKGMTDRQLDEEPH